MDGKDRVAAGVGLLSITCACDPPYYTSEAFFANTTRQTVDVRLSVQTAQVDCERVAGRAAHALRPSAFEPEALYRIGPGEVLPLQLDQDPPSPSRNVCSVALQILGLPDVSVFWHPGGADSERHADLRDPNFLARSIRLEGAPGVYRWAAGAELEVGDASLGQPIAGETPRPFGWSAIASGFETTISRRRVLGDGCFAVDHDSPSTSGTFYLCAPEWAFPFDAGDTISVTLFTEPGLSPAQERTRHRARRLLVRDAGIDPPRSLELWLGALRGHAGSTQLETLENGEHHGTCGAYVEPLAVRVRTAGNAEILLQAGEVRESEPGARMLLGRAERVLVALPGCESERAELGERFDLLLLREPP